jgi:endonuclease/exonuclease/phosphatase family metal-dependent hydrolase
VLKVGFQDPELLAETASGVWEEVLANDFRDRAVAIVDAIEAAGPDLVGVQELACFRDRAMNPGDGSMSVVETLDYQAILEEELRSRGLSYAFAAVVENTAAVVPTKGIREKGRFIPTRSVEMTLQDAILVRDGVRVENTATGHYQAGVSLGINPSTPGPDRVRGWTRVDTRVDGVPVHFVNTHLETQPFRPVQQEQIRELLNEVVPSLEGITILAGDFNSDAAAPAGAWSWTPTYEEITKAGFEDAWAVSRGEAEGGFTCSRSSDLKNPNRRLDQRIDFVFFRGLGPAAPTSDPGGFPWVEADVVGAAPEKGMSPGGRWPSDHAGVVATFSLSRS